MDVQIIDRVIESMDSTDIPYLCNSAFAQRACELGLDPNYEVFNSDDLFELFPQGRLAAFSQH